MSGRAWKLSILVLSAAAVAFVQVSATAGRPLAELLPAGALLVLESPGFGDLATRWHGSPEKALWLESANYEAFSRSKLFFRLKEAQAEFSAVAGLPTDVALLDSIAGGESALAVYDIGELGFVYLTRLESARTFETLLWRRRANFESRSTAGVTYYARDDGESGRSVAFAVIDDLLIVGTNADLVARSIRLTTGETVARLIDEQWYAAAVPTPDGQTPALRMRYNLAALIRTPHFRSYWIHQNATQLRSYSAGASDLYFTNEGLREERALVKTAPTDAPEIAPVDLGRILSAVPSDSDFFRLRAGVASQEIAQLLGRKLFQPKVESGVRQDAAPAAYLAGSSVGSESQLETRIDIAPARRSDQGLDLSRLTAILETAGVDAVGEIAQARLSPGGVLVRVENALVVTAQSDWDPSSIRAALSELVLARYGAAAPAGDWTQRGNTFALDGLAPLFFETRGKLLVVSNADALHTAIVRSLETEPPNLVATEVLGFRHGIARVGYETLMSHLDFINNGYGDDPDRAPYFFSENVLGLGQALARVEEVRVTRHHESGILRETVEYE